MVAGPRFLDGSSVGKHSSEEDSIVSEDRSSPQSRSPTVGLRRHRLSAEDVDVALRRGLATSTSPLFASERERVRTFAMMNRLVYPATRFEDYVGSTSGGSSTTGSLREVYAGNFQYQGRGATVEAWSHGIGLIITSYL